MLSSTTVLAATIRVPQDYPTIQAGIDAATDGDTVLVADGIYTGEGNRGLYIAEAITIKSENGPKNCVIDCEKEDYYAFSVGNVTSLVISGFTINNCTTGIVCMYLDPSITITDCTISGGTDGIMLASDSTISGCTVSDNTLYGMYLFDGSATVTGCTIMRNLFAGIYHGNGELTIDVSTISDNAGFGGILLNNSNATITNSTINNNVPGSGGGIYSSYSFTTITNCTISNNATAVGGGIVCFNSPMTITNSILWENTPYEIKLIGGTVDVTYSDIQGGYTGTGNLNLDPLFVGGGDYHLTASSPCIDAGTSGGAPDHDIDGQSRPAGAGYDIGADEYGGTVPPPTWTTGYRTMFSNQSDLELLRQYRDEFLTKTAKGKLYTELLYKSSEEALEVLLDNPRLTLRARRLIETNKDAVAEVLDGNRGVIYNTDEIISFLDAYARKSPPSLRLLAITVKKEMIEKHKQGEPFLGFELH